MRFGRSVTISMVMNGNKQRRNINISLNVILNMISECSDGFNSHYQKFKKWKQQTIFELVRGTRILML
jgi:hypothetical protein